MAMSIVRNPQNKAEDAGSTPPELLSRENDEIRAAASVDIGKLLLSASSYNVLLVSLHMILKLTSICSFISMVYTAKFEALLCSLLTSTCSDDSEALRKSPALQTLFTEL